MASNCTKFRPFVWTESIFVIRARIYCIHIPPGENASGPTRAVYVGVFKKNEQKYLHRENNNSWIKSLYSVEMQKYEQDKNDTWKNIPLKHEFNLIPHEMIAQHHS